MPSLSYLLHLQAGWLNAWIPSFALVLVQFVYMLIFKAISKRAIDTSWYTAKDKKNALASTILQIALLVLSIFVPLRVGTAWFIAGAAIYILSMAAFITAFYSYAAAPLGKTIENGIYRWSRNPMYFFFFTGMLGVCIASASLWLLAITIPFVIATHFIILGEERYCAATYGDEYLAYKARTPRYFLFL